MARPLRIEYPGALYHITSRGIDRRDIFKDDNDRERFVRLLQEGVDFYRVEVIAYCLMSNHFHFLICTKKANLSRFMQRLNVAYTRYFNLKYRRVGPLMQGRYKAILVGSNDYFLTLSRYICLNPVKTVAASKLSKADQERLLLNYRWSSLPGLLDPGKRKKYLQCEQVLDLVGGDNEKGRTGYKEYVLEGITEDSENPMSELHCQFLLGSKEFIARTKDTYFKTKDLKPFLPSVRKINQITVEEIAAVVANEYRIRPQELVAARSPHKEARKVLIELAYRLCLANSTLKELGKELGGISGPGIVRVHERLQDRIKTDAEYCHKIIKLEKSFCQWLVPFWNKPHNMGLLREKHKHIR